MNANALDRTYQWLPRGVWAVWAQGTCGGRVTLQIHVVTWTQPVVFFECPPGTVQCPVSGRTGRMQHAAEGAATGMEAGRGCVARNLGQFYLTGAAGRSSELACSTWLQVAHGLPHLAPQRRSALGRLSDIASCPAIFVPLT